MPTLVPPEDLPLVPVEDLPEGSQAPQPSSGFDLSLLPKGLVSGTLTGAGNIIGGLENFIPGQHPIMESVASGLENATPNWNQQVQQAMGQPGMDSNKLMAMLGQAVPQGIMSNLSAKGGEALGLGVGGLLGLESGAKGGEGGAVAGGVTGAGLLGGAGAVLGSIAPFIPMGSRQFTLAAKNIPGIDPVLIDTFAREYGAESSVTMALSRLPGIGPYLAAMKGTPVASTFMSMLQTAGVQDGLVKGFARILGKEAVEAGVAGGAGAATSLIFNANLDKLVEAQNKQNSENGLPPVDPRIVDTLHQKWQEGFTDWAALTAVMRAPAAAYGAGKQVVQSHLNMKEGAAMSQAMEDGTVLTKPDPTAIVAPYTAAYKEALAGGVTPDLLTKRYEEKIGTTEVGTVARQDAVAKIAEAWGIPTKTAKGGDIDATDLDLMIRAKINSGKAQEGIYLDERGNVHESPVTVNTVSAVEKSRGDLWHKMLLQTVGEPRERVEGADTDGKPVVMVEDPMRQIKQTALAEAKGRTIAQAMTQDGTPTEEHIRTLLNNYDYSLYVDALEGATKTEMSKLNGLMAEKQPEILAGLHEVYSKIPLDKGTSLSLEAIPPSKSLSYAFSTYGRLYDVLQHVANRYPRLPVLTVFNDAMKRIGYAHDLQRMSGLAVKYWVRQLPAELRGDQGAAKTFNALVDWHTQDAAQRKKIEAVFEINSVGKTLEQVQNEFVQKVSKAGAKTPPSEILRLSKWMGGRYEEGKPMSEQARKVVLYRWWMKNGIVDPEKARAIYSPIIRQYIKDVPEEYGGDGHVEIDQWLWTKKGDLNFRKNLPDLSRWADFGKPEGAVKDLFDLALSKRNSEVVEMPKPGKRKSPMEKARTSDPLLEAEHIREVLRKSDDARLRQLDYVTEPEDEAFYYSKFASRRLAFRTMVPAFERLYDMVQHEVQDPVDRKLIVENLQALMEEVAGIPDLNTRAWSRGKQIPGNTTAMVNWLSRGHLALEQHSFFRRYFQDPRWITKNDLSAGISTFMYGMALGLPNVKSPLMNLLTQGPQVIPMLGLQTTIKGWYHFLTDPKMVKNLEARNLRPTNYFHDTYESGKRHGLSRVAQSLLYMFAATDWMNSTGASAGAEVAWRRMEPFLKDDPKARSLTDSQIMDLLVRNKSVLVDPEKVFTEDTHSAKRWSGAVNKTLMQNLVEQIRAGHSEAAHDMWLRYSTDFSQWHYGPGGTGMNWRGPIKRNLLMFMSWPASYVPFMGRTVGGGLNQLIHDHSRNGTTLIWRTFQMYALQSAIIGAVHEAIGLKGGARYIGLGPLPSSLSLQGQPSQLVSAVLQYINAENQILSPIGTRDDETKAIRERDAALKQMSGVAPAYTRDMFQ